MHFDALLIVNNKARNGRSDLQRGIELLYEAGWNIREELPAHPERIPELIRQYGPQAERIIIGSGDGTLNRAAEALLECRRPLGLIPLGTANDLARTLCIPADPAEACRIIHAGRLHAIDLGQVNGKHFFNAANIGLGVKVTRRLTGAAKRRWGVLAYIRSLIDAFQAHRPFQVELVIDGREERFTSIEVAVGNGRHYGGGMTIAADARIDDHQLHLFSLRPQGLTRLATLALALRRGELRDKEEVLLRSGTEFEIRTRRPMEIDTDGELTSCTPAHFKVVRDALSVYVPAEYHDSP